MEQSADRKVTQCQSLRFIFNTPRWRRWFGSGCEGDVVTAEKNAAEGLDLKESGCSEHAVHDNGKACIGNKQPLWCACQLLALGPE
jgi:hypothetical protein